MRPIKRHALVLLCLLMAAGCKKSPAPAPQAAPASPAAPAPQPAPQLPLAIKNVLPLDNAECEGALLIRCDTSKDAAQQWPCRKPRR